MAYALFTLSKGIWLDKYINTLIVSDNYAVRLIEYTKKSSLILVFLFATISAEDRAGQKMKIDRL